MCSIAMTMITKYPSQCCMNLKLEMRQKNNSFFLDPMMISSDCPSVEFPSLVMRKQLNVVVCLVMAVRTSCDLCCFCGRAKYIRKQCTMW